MADKHAYSYIVLRYVHDVVAGEAINVGVVMYVPSTGKLIFRTHKRVGRLRQVFPDLDKGAFVEAMKAVDRGLSALTRQASGEPLIGRKVDASYYALKVVPTDDSAMQWSQVSAGLTSNDEKTFDGLFYRYVTQHDSKAEHRRSNDDVWRPVREKLAEKNISIPFKQKVVTGANDKIEFDKAWKNGKWHAYEALSFDLAEADGIKDKARKWMGHLAAVKEGASDEVEVHFILGRPQSGALMKAYKDAKAILEGAPFTEEVVDERDIDLFVSGLEDEYRAHERMKERRKNRVHKS